MGWSFQCKLYPSISNFLTPPFIQTLISFGMKNKLPSYVIAFTILSLISIQTTIAKKSNYYYISASFNQTYIYTGLGDTKGYSFTTSISRNLNKFLDVELEYRMASGRLSPAFNRALNHKTIHYIEVKGNLYPFRSSKNESLSNLIGGLHVGMGPC